MTETEIRKIKRIYDWAVSPTEQDIVFGRKNFSKFITEHDIRRNTNFINIFPELENFYKNSL